jgi:hypothetical protein
VFFTHSTHSTKANIIRGMDRTAHGGRFVA